MSESAGLMDDQSANHFLAQGEAALRAGDRALAAHALGCVRAHPVARLQAHNLIERHRLEGAFGEWMGVNCEISPHDDIYRFFDNHPTSINPLRDYLADGWRTLSELMLLLESVQRPLMGMDSVLEFASGHGRFTRHLMKALGSGRLTASDVVPDAVDFARHTLGVPAFLSTALPEDLKWAQRYDLVFVLSLFSHLPRTTWGRWLKRLYEGVAPGGTLVVSTHGAAAARRQGVELDANGFYFAPASESQMIAVADYGTTFSSEAYVRTQIAEYIGTDCIDHLSPAHFWAHQDAWVLRGP